MNAPAARRNPQLDAGAPRPADVEGSTIVEMLVAAALTVLSLGMLLGNVVVPLGILQRSHDAAQESLELVAAAEEFARLVRSARPGILEPAAAAGGHGDIILRVPGDQGLRYVRIAFLDDSLVADRIDQYGAVIAGTRRQLVSGLDPGSGGLLLHDRSAPGGAGVPRPSAVTLIVARDGRVLERTVALRIVGHLEAPGGR